jgi:hypothetical protein
MKRFSFVTIIASLSLLLAGCGVNSEAKYPTGANRAATNGDIYAKPKSVLGADGGNLFGGKNKASSDVITVNAYLWRAALDTISFMPIASVDPFGGVILTDWYSDPATPNERYKLNVFVIGSQLRSDGIKVSMFKQRGGKNVAVDDKTNRDIEDSILTRARELRVADKQAE